MIEIFKDIKGYEGLYKVSNFGRIKSLARKVKNKKGNYQLFNEMIRTQTLSQNGYFRIRLSKRCKCKCHPVHRLVAIAFIENIDGKPYINHKDGDKINNNVSNLEWCTQSENTKHAYKNNLANNKGEKHSQSVLSDNQVLEIRKLMCLYSRKNLSKMFNVPYETISNIVSRRTYKHI